MLTRFAGALATVAAIVAFGPVATAYAPGEGARFNDPRSNFSTPTAIMNAVDAKIDGTVSGDTILISTYLFDRAASADKLVAAWNRGVHVQVVMDQYIEATPAKTVMQKFNADNDRSSELDPLTGQPYGRGGPDHSFAFKCVGSCRGAAGNNHSKFYAFSESGGVENIVMVSSANLNKGGMYKGWNDLYTMIDAGTYAKYAYIHNEMADDTPRDGDRYQVYVTDGGRYESRFFPMQNPSKSTDPVMIDLSKVSCSGGTALHIAMFHWSDSRGIYIANRILELARNGCNVSIIYGAPGTKVASLLKNAAHRGLIRLFDTRVDRNDDGAVDLRVHSKYMLIAGNYAGDTSAKQVYTGSQNWTNGALTRADEILLGIKDDTAYNSYLNNWFNLRNTASRPIR